MFSLSCDILIYFTMCCYIDCLHNKLNQSINQSTNQPINQSINKSINQSINQPTNKSINQSTIMPTTNGDIACVFQVRRLSWRVSVLRTSSSVDPRRRMSASVSPRTGCATETPTANRPTTKRTAVSCRANNSAFPVPITNGKQNHPVEVASGHCYTRVVILNVGI